MDEGGPVVSSGANLDSDAGDVGARVLAPMGHLRRVLVFVRPHRRAAGLSLLLLAVVACMDLAIPRLIQHIIDHGIAAGDPAVVALTSVAMIGISALSTLAAIGNNALSVRAGEGVARDLREALFVKVQSLSSGNLDRLRTGDLLVRLTSDVSAVRTLVQISLRIGTRAPLMMLGSLLMMVATSRELALSLLPLLCVAGAVIVFFIVKMEPRYALVQSRLDALNNVLQENIAGVRLVKALVRAEHERERFAVANDELTQRSIAVMTFTSSMAPLLTLCVNIGLLIVVWSGGLKAIAGRLSLGELVAFANYILSLMTPLVLMTMLSSIWASGLASARRITQVLETVPDVQDSPSAMALPADAPGSVSFERVSLSYHGTGSEPALDDIDLDVKPGETIGIVGATGAGKTTLVNLIARAYDPTAGSVRIAGHDLRELTLDSVLAQVGMVPQEALLFSGSVSENIRYGKPDASDAEVVAAARAAQADEFVSRLPGGYAAQIAQRGANLSGGQRQRLAIARALLPKPKILILDDSTSAVDLETEAKVHEALLSSKGDRTTFIVAQRISTVLAADQIVVLDKGRIAARGRHRELLLASAVYREIYESQLGPAPELRAMSFEGAEP